MNTATAQLTLDDVIDRVETDGAIQLDYDEAPNCLRKATTRLELARKEIFVDYQGDKVSVHKQGVRVGPAGTIIQRFRVTMVVEASSESDVRQHRWAVDSLEKIEAISDDD